jgi:hypothetical protein
VDQAAQRFAPASGFSTRCSFFPEYEHQRPSQFGQGRILPNNWSFPAKATSFSSKDTVKLMDGDEILRCFWSVTPEPRMLGGH